MQSNGRFPASARFTRCHSRLARYCTKFAGVPTFCRKDVPRHPHEDIMHFHKRQDKRQEQQTRTPRGRGGCEAKQLAVLAMPCTHLGGIKTGNGYPPSHHQSCSNLRISYDVTNSSKQTEYRQVLPVINRHAFLPLVPSLLSIPFLVDAGREGRGGKE